MGAHIIDGQFQSDKYPDCPRGLVPFKVTDRMAQDLLWEYANRRRSIDEAFAANLRRLLLDAGYKPGTTYHPLQSIDEVGDGHTMADRFDIPNFEIEEGERLTLEPSVTGGNVTWVVRLRCGRLVVHGHLTQEAIDAAEIDIAREFMDHLRQKIDEL